MASSYDLLQKSLYVRADQLWSRQNHHYGPDLPVGEAGKPLGYSLFRHE